MVPWHIRKPVVLIIGLLFVIAAGLTGWLPGPGGIPLFLIGIAILATEFVWAEKARDWILDKGRSTVDYIKKRKHLLVITGGLMTLVLASAFFFAYNLYIRS